MARLTKTDIRKKALLSALEKSLGVVSPACSAAGVSRETFYEWCRTDPKFKAAVDGLGEVALDFAETKLLTRIKDESDTAIIFYLKTKGRKRGYSERLEVTGANGAPVNGEAQKQMSRDEILAEGAKWGLTEQDLYPDE